MKKKGFAILLGALLLPWSSITVSAKDISPDSVFVGEWVTSEGEYTYPVTPENDAWATMDYAEKRNVCNMPQELVDALSTAELVDLALDYPLKLDYLMFDSYALGIEHLKSSSNVYHELFEREDAAEVLLAVYADLQVDYDILVSNMVENPMEASGYDKELVLQLLLASDEIFDTMVDEQVTDLVETIGAKYEEKEGTCEDFTTALTFYSVFSEENETISANLIPESIYEDMVVSTAAQTGFVPNGNYGTLENTKSNVYEGDYWKYGTSCKCYKYDSGDYTVIEASAITGSYLGAHPEWTFKSGPTKKYNCHSYCWINKSYDNIYWLSNPTNFANATSYFTSYGSNKKITNSNSYIILFNSGDPIHSVRSIGVSSGNSLDEWMKSVKVESKLGAHGVYETTLYDMIIFYGAGYYNVYTEK